MPNAIPMPDKTEPSAAARVTHPGVCLVPKTVWCEGLDPGSNLNREQLPWADVWREEHRERREGQLTASRQNILEKGCLSQGSSERQNQWYVYKRSFIMRNWLL